MVDTVIKSAQKTKQPPGLPFKYVKDTAADEGPEIDKFFKSNIYKFENQKLGDRLEIILTKTTEKFSSYVMI